MDPNNPNSNVESSDNRANGNNTFAEHRSRTESRNNTLTRNGTDFEDSVTNTHVYDNSIAYIDSEIHIDGDTSVYTNGRTLHSEISPTWNFILYISIYLILDLTRFW